jgi:predicted negative regulator of RcsB-dependent stress response
METQESTTLYLLKLWQWVEANKNRLIGGAVVIAVAIFVYSFISYQRGQKEIAAGKALTQLSVTPGGTTPEAVLKIADEYPGTMAGQRALLTGATLLFQAGKYPEAQAAFQKFLRSPPDSVLAGQAALGVATSLEMQGKASAIAYKGIVDNYTDPGVVAAAKFALGRIAEAQGKLQDALELCQQAAQVNPGSTLGYEAGMHIVDLKNRMAASPPVAAPAATSAPAPFTLTPTTPAK